MNIIPQKMIMKVNTCSFMYDTLNIILYKIKIMGGVGVGGGCGAEVHSLF